MSELLIDAVDSGASIGFLPPVAQSDARQYWHTVFDSVRSGTRVLLAAEDRDRIVGSAQLGLESRANGRHRAEVMKLMVHRTARGKGIGRALMGAVETSARDRGITLLVLDTRREDVSERLYTKLGYTRAGTIPKYARSASGELHDTVIMYKEISTTRE